MNDLIVIVPTRGRLANIRALVDVWHETGTTARLEFGMDADDPTVDEVVGPLLGGHDHPWLSIVVGQPVGMAGTLNALARMHASDYRYIGFMGDDHRPRTPGWDRTIVSGLDDRAFGIGYGDDLVHGPALPTAVVVSSAIVRTLGWMAPPKLQHLYLDNFWLTFGEALGSLRYFPDVVIEHMHPIAGKAPMDEGYERVNAGAIQAHDQAEYERWKTEDLERDVRKVRAGASVP